MMKNISWICLLWLLLSPANAFHLPMTQANPLASWNDTAVRQRILDYISSATNPTDPGYVPVAERIAVFDLNGTLLCERPQPLEETFALHKMREQGSVGSESASDVEGKPRSLQPFAGMSQDDSLRYAQRFLEQAMHPRFNRPYAELLYAPMLELMALLAQKDFTVYVVTDTTTRFARAALAGQDILDTANITGASAAMEFRVEQGKPVFIRQADFWTRPGRPADRLWLTSGRAPVFAAGNSSADTELLDYASHNPRPSLALFLLHDDAEREYDYVDESALAMARENGWLIVSMRDDFRHVFVQP